MYSFSTCWNSARHTDGRALMREIRELGFEYVELSHGIRISLLPGVLDAVDAGEIKISSVHNFCPLPLGVVRAAPNIYQFTADDERERDSARRHTLKTLETAARVQAGVVVLHLGSVEVKDYTGPLLEKLAENPQGPPKFDRLRDEALEKVRKKKERPMKRVSEALEWLAGQAAEHGVRLGLENRQALEELPMDGDLGTLLNEFDSPAVGYWHDCGHAQIKQHLGVIQHAEQLQMLAPRLIGFHIHDVTFPGRDHRAPGTGTVDFAALKPCVRPEHVKVFEFSPSLDVDAVKAGAAHVRGIWGPE